MLRPILVEAIAIRLEDITTRVEAIASKQQLWRNKEKHIFKAHDWETLKEVNPAAVLFIDIYSLFTCYLQLVKKL